MSVIPVVITQTSLTLYLCQSGFKDKTHKLTIKKKKFVKGIHSFCTLGIYNPPNTLEIIFKLGVKTMGFFNGKIPHIL